MPPGGCTWSVSRAGTAAASGSKCWSRDSGRLKVRRDSATHAPHSRGESERHIFGGRRHSTFYLVAQGTCLVAIETSEIHSGRTLSEQKRIPVICEGFKSHCDRQRLF